MWVDHKSSKVIVAVALLFGFNLVPIQAYKPITCILNVTPGAKLQDMSQYASHGGITVALYPDSCMCQQCYIDHRL